MRNLYATMAFLVIYDRSKFTEDPEKVAAENEQYYGEAMRH